MFKCFNKAARPKHDEQPPSWDELFSKPSTEKYLASVNSAGEGSSKQVHDSQCQEPSAQSTTNNKPHCNDYNGNRSSSPPLKPNTATGDNDVYSASCGSHAGTDAKEAATEEKAATVPAPHHHHTTSVFAPRPLKEEPAAAPSLSADSGTHTTFSAASPPPPAASLQGAGGGAFSCAFGAGSRLEQSAAPVSAFAPAYTSTPAARPTPAARSSLRSTASFEFGGGGSAPFGGFRGASAAATEFSEASHVETAPPTATLTPAASAAAAGVARMFRSAMDESVRATASPAHSTPSQTQIHKKEDTVAPSSTAQQGFTGFGTMNGVVPAPSTNEKQEFAGFGALNGAAEKKGFSGFASMKSAKELIPSPPKTVAASAESAFASFGTTAKNTVTPAPSQPTNSFAGFGTLAKVAAPAPTASVQQGFSGFGTTSGAVPAPSSSGATLAPPPTNSFAGFGTTAKNTVTPVPSQPTNSFAGFGALTKVTVPAPTASVQQGFSGFGTTNGAVPAPSSSGATLAPPPTNSFAGFGALAKVTVAAPAPPAPSENDFAALGTVAKSAEEESNSAHSAASMEEVREDFGSLHVSGPAHIMKVLAEREAEWRRRPTVRVGEQEEEVPQVNHEVVEEEEKVADTTVDSLGDDTATEADDDVEPEPRYPWGKRPCFREMLEGGSKKLVLISPPPFVSQYFMDQVFRSYGCAYDNVDNIFYATSPGRRESSNGTVVALDGNTTRTPVCVAKDLAEPAAVACYEPGLSVCVVTNRGIFVFTKHAGGEAYLSRQISTKPFHRGIAVTMGGGIISFCPGRLRLFDGMVANGQEKVLAEVNYDNVVNNALFVDKPNRRMEKSNCCFMDIVNNRLVISDLQKHVISLWEVEETAKGCAIHFLRAIDVAACENPPKGKPLLRGSQVPLGKCSYAAGIRLDAEGWVLCADAEGRNIQIYDDQLNFVTRVQSSEQLPYISGLYIEAKGHLMLCDRRSEMGGLRVYLLEPREKDEKDKQQSQPVQLQKKPVGFAAAARQQAGGRF